jgi:hypothetical protein
MLALRHTASLDRKAFRVTTNYWWVGPSLKGWGLLLNPARSPFEFVTGPFWGGRASIASATLCLEKWTWLNILRTVRPLQSPAKEASTYE